MNLNEQQQAAVASTAALTVVASSPATGKTRVTQYRIAAATGAVVALSYTNVGADEMRARLGDKRLEYCGTLHAYCYRLLQRFGDLLGYRAGGIAILPEREKLPRLKAIRDRLGKRRVTDTMLMRYDPFDSPPLTDAFIIRNEYAFELKRANMVDFDMILRDGYALLQMPEVRSKIGVSGVVADEAQDFSELDWRIFFDIPAKTRFVVGDYDQSIFGWRGASPSAFLSLMQPGSAANVVVLEKNYRSDRAICCAASALIAHNTDRVAKAVIPVSEAEGDVAYHEFEDNWQEMEWTALQIRCELQQGHSVGVLCRTNYLAKQCQTFLRANEIPLETKTWAAPEDWDRALTLVGLCVAPDNEILIERWLRLRMGEREAADTMRLWRSTGNCRAFFDSIGSTSQLLDAMTRESISPDTVALVAERAAAVDGDIADLLHDLHAIDEWMPMPESSGVYVGTIHGYKGREADTIFIPAFEQGVMPMTKSDTDIAEERRVAFVAVTRARHRLVMTSAAIRKPQFGPATQQQPSQFLKEMNL